MLNLNFFASWTLGEKSWSGTQKSLLDALQVHFNVNNFDITLAGFDDFVRKVGRVFYPNDFNKLAWPLYTRKYTKYLKNNHANVNLFLSDLGQLPGIENGYIYQDLSVSSIIWWMKQEPALFKYSGYNIKIENLLWREKKQLENYSKLRGIFTMSHWLERNLIEYSGIPQSKVHYIGAGINIDSSKINYSKKQGNKILFVGRDFERKAGNLVIEAFRILREKRSEVELYIVGCTKQLDVKGVYWLGDIPSSELYKWFNTCDVFCMPSYFEAFGLVFIEALTFGLPVIARNNFAMKELIEDGKTGYLVDNNDVENLAKKIFDALSNDNMYNEVRSRKQMYQDKYSWDTVAKRIYSIVERGLSLI